MGALFFDLEGDGLYEDITKIWCICIGDSTGRVQRFSDGRVSTGESFDGTISDALEQLAKADTIIGHNIIGFDIPVLKKLYPTFNPRGSARDTLVLSRLFNPDRAGGHSLKAWGERLKFPKGDYDDWTALSKEMVDYCVQDVNVTIAVYKALKNEIKGQKWGESIQLEHEVAEIIAQQEVNGFKFNDKLASDCVSQILEHINDIDQHLSKFVTPSVKPKGVRVSEPFKKNGYLKKVAEAVEAFHSVPAKVVGPYQKVEIVGVDFNSIHQVKKWLLEMGWKPTEFTEKGAGKLTEDSFDSLTNRELGELMADRVAHRHRLGQIQGWLNNQREDGRISAGANTIGTPTGRFRHSRVVNVPSASTYPKGHTDAGKLHWYSDKETKQNVLLGTEMRAMFCCGEGYKIVGHDASQLELRMLAHYMNDDQYIEELLNGDIHSHNQKLAGLHTRAAAKTFIYAFNYGAGNAKLGSIVQGGESEGAEIRARFLRENPKLKQLITKVQQKAKRDGFLRGLDGRRIYLRRDQSGKVMAHKALNTLLQCAGAVVMKKSIVLLDSYAKREQLDFRKVVDMHDEGQAEVLEAHAERYAELAVQSIIDAGKHFNLRVPLDADSSIGMNWAETH